MRWKGKEPVYWGAYREITKFAWWPISTEQETRWLERVKVQQTYERKGFRYYWKTHCFMDE